MAGRTFVLFPRNTTLAGSLAGTGYRSDPIAAREYSRFSATIDLTSARFGTSVTAQLEDSADRNTWTGIGSPTSVTAGSPVTLLATQPAAYLRLLLTISGTNSLANLSATGLGRFVASIVSSGSGGPPDYSPSYRWQIDEPRSFAMLFPLAAPKLSGFLSKPWQPFLDQVKDMGINTLKLFMPWRVIYPEIAPDDPLGPAAAKFQFYDEIAQYAVTTLGMKLVIKDAPIHAPDWLIDRFPKGDVQWYWWPSFQGAWLNPAWGRVGVGEDSYPDPGYKQVQTHTDISFASAEMRKLMRAGTEVMINHFRSLPFVGPDTILFAFTPSTAMAGEDSYNPWSDYGLEAQEDFRTWLKQRYGTIGRLSSEWGIRYKDFKDVFPPALIFKGTGTGRLPPGFVDLPKIPPIEFKWEDDYVITQSRYLDWVRYRRFSQLRQTNDMARVIHSAGVRACFQNVPPIGYITGAVPTYDTASLPYVDVICFDDGADWVRDPEGNPVRYPHAYSIDILAGTFPARRFGTATLPNNINKRRDEIGFRALENSNERQAVAWLQRGGWYLEWDGTTVFNIHGDVLSGGFIDFNADWHWFHEEVKRGLKTKARRGYGDATITLSDQAMAEHFVNVPYFDKAIENWETVSQLGEKLVDVEVVHDLS